MLTNGSRKGALTAGVVGRRLWGSSPFFLIDVGCSGGIDQQWDVFGDALRAIGFDPLVAEIARLNERNRRSGVSYEAGFVTCRDYDRLFPPELQDDVLAVKKNNPMPRVSARAVQTSSSYLQEFYNAGAPIELSSAAVVLDDRIDSKEHRRVDFLKSDTDGHDLEVLLGAEAIMAAGGVLGVKVEGSFHGALHPYANTFANIHAALIQRGYNLFGLTPHRYSRAALPAPFELDLPAQTRAGQVVWVDALYFRDLASLEYERMWPYDVTAERVMKLACLYDLYDLPDCAAELLLTRGSFLDPPLREELLDRLVTGEPGSYAAHIAAFEHDHTAFFPSRVNPLEGDPPLGKKDEWRQKIRAMREQITKLKAENAELRERVKARGERIEQLTMRLQAGVKPGTRRV